MGGKYDLRHFRYSHLPSHLQRYSKVIHDVASEMVEALPAGAERNAGLRKLLEAKDCFVRAAVEAHPHTYRTNNPEIRPVPVDEWMNRDPISGHPLPADSPYSQAHHNSMRYDVAENKYIVTKNGVTTKHDAGCMAIQFGECTCKAVKNDNDSI